jgi:hypothetical protein
MTKRRPPDEFNFLTRKEITARFNIPPRVVDQWIATGQITSMRVSVFGRGGQRVFYSAADARKLTLVKTPRKRRPRAPRSA